MAAIGSMARCGIQDCAQNVICPGRAVDNRDIQENQRNVAEAGNHAVCFLDPRRWQPPDHQLPGISKQPNCVVHENG